MTPEMILLIAGLILVLPILGFTFNIFLGKRLGKASAWIATTIMGLDLLLSVILVVVKVFGHIKDYKFISQSGAVQLFANDALVQIKIAWLDLGKIVIKVGIGIDNLAALMLIVVTLISFLVHLFSIEYMADDKRFSRYFAYLGLFTFSMLGIVIANNFLFMYIFWELVGISSYLLIGFWYEKKSASDAGKKAFIVNRIGDLGFFVGIMILFFTYGSLMFDDIFGGLAKGIIPYDSGTWLTVSGILIFMGAIGKSAQFPLHVWLPDAMEGPTPVSALIHAATMVAAGVYMVARVFPLFSADALTFIAAIGAITAFLAATIALTQNDFKKVLAYSTVSQLGYMVMSLGVGAYTSGFFHLMTHAWFKAALFLASGSVIHAMHHAMHNLHDHNSDPQDIRNMGGLKKTMPWTYYTFLLVTLTISGVPLTSGFLSKDSILAGTLAYAQLTGGWRWLIPIAGFGAAGMTAFYMFRLLILAFHGEHNTEIAAKTHENKFVVVFPLVILSVLSLWFFYSPNPIDAHKGWFYEKIEAPVQVLNSDYQFNFLLPEEHKKDRRTAAVQTASSVKVENNEISATNENTKEARANGVIHEAKTQEHGASSHHYPNKFEEQVHHAHVPAMILSLLIAGIGLLFSFFMYQFKMFNPDKLASQFKPLYTGSLNKWYFDEIYQATAVALTVGVSKVLGYFDNWVIDGMVNASSWVTRKCSYITGHFDNIVIDGFVNLSANVTGMLGASLRKVQTGRIQTYLVFVIIGVILIFYFLL